MIIVITLKDIIYYEEDYNLNQIVFTLRCTYRELDKYFDWGYFNIITNIGHFYTGKNFKLKYYFVIT
jgi:hypothetical protein